MAVTPGNTGQPVRYGLELEGVSVGTISSFAGGDAFGDVVSEPAGNDGIVHKHLGSVNYHDICFTCGPDMANALFDWLKQTLGGTVVRKQGAVVGLDAVGNEVSRLNFLNAVVNEVGFPALDASSKDAATLSIKISPETTQSDAGSSSSQHDVLNKAKKWLSSNFRLTIGGVVYSSVSRIEAITVKSRDLTAPIGAPDLAITLGIRNADATALQTWFNSFVIQGNNGQDQEKNGKLEYLSSDLKTSLFTLDLRQLGVYSLARVSDEASSQTVPRIKAAMYCEQVLFSYGSDAADSTNLLPITILQPALSNVTLTQQPSPVGSGTGTANSGPQLPSVSSLGRRAPRNLTPAVGPRNQPAVQEQPNMPSPPPVTSLAFRNLSQ